MRCTTPHVGRALLVIALGLIFSLTATAQASPRMWGIDGQDAYLFSIEDYRHPIGTFTPRGPLQWDDTGTIRPPANTWYGQPVVQSFVIDGRNTAYIVINRDLRDDLPGPVLASIDLNRARPAGNLAPQVVRIIGSLRFPEAWGDAKVTGLAVDIHNAQVARNTNRVDRGSRADDRRLLATVQTGSGLSQLISIDKHTARPLPGGGPLTGKGYHLLAAEDLAFDRNGFLYVTDSMQGRLFRVDAATGRVIAPIRRDPQMLSDDVTAMRFEPVSGVMVGFQGNTGSMITRKMVAGDLVLADTAIAPQLVGVQGLDFQYAAPKIKAMSWNPSGGGGIAALWAGTPGVHGGLPLAAGAVAVNEQDDEDPRNPLTPPDDLPKEPEAPEDPEQPQDPKDPKDPKNPKDPDGPDDPTDPPFDPENPPFDPEEPKDPDDPDDPFGPPTNPDPPTGDPHAVPEPTSAVLLLMSVVGLLVWATRRREAA